MRVFVLLFLIGLTCAAPQGYNYQIDSGFVQTLPNQYQYYQQQPQVLYQQQQQQFGQLPQFVQPISLDQQGGYQFGNQLLQNAQQVIQYEQQQNQIAPQPQQITQLQQPEIPIFSQPQQIAQQQQPEIQIVSQPQQITQLQQPEIPIFSQPQQIAQQQQPEIQIVSQPQQITQQQQPEIQLQKAQTEQQITNQPEIQIFEQKPKSVKPQQVEIQTPSTTIAEEPRVEIVPTIEAPKPVEIVETPKPVERAQLVIDSQPEFVIQSKQPIKPETLYQAPEQINNVVFQKEFYYLSAPKDEDEDETPKELESQLTTLKKNLRVVFIKAPENNGLEKAALKFAQQSANSQTAIYVLSKQHDASDLAHKLQSIQSSTPQRPEVQFIKYRTPEEAEHAQRVIQAQYEALDGPNHINRPGTGVTHNFVGATAVEPRKPSPVFGGGEKVEIKKPVSKYLPITKKH